ncbi:MAG: bifunctional adenosylcobinamide kinase/adenosylcobinamide-phosphate guanylyltransferase [Eubacteriales bacterium]
MSRIYYITGGAYSGKSALAENIADNFERLGIITFGGKHEAKKEDDSEEGKAQKTSNWERIEVDEHCDSILIEKDFDLFVLDSLTALVKRRFHEGLTTEKTFNSENLREISESVSREVMNMVVAAKENDRNLLVISSEVGMGTLPDSDALKFLRAETGRANQLMASLADEAYLLVSGIPIKIKG